nr:ribonuclease 3-like protein 3 [Tanacetum cinerariifolium]
MELEQELEKVIISLQNLTVSQPPLSELETITGYTFKNKDLLKEAFTHASYKAVDSNSYERLEYIGDSVLNHLVAKLHYFMYPDMMPGDLTRLRAANVDTEALARAALKYKLHKYLRHKKPLLDKKIRDFMEEIVEFPTHSYGMIDPPKVLADILESLIGAIFIDTDKSMDETWEVVKCLLQPFVTSENIKLHPCAKFNEACQKNGLKPKAIDMWSQTGEFEIYIGNELVGTGKYKSKKMVALNRAADDAYNYLFGKLGNKDGGIGG